MDENPLAVLVTDHCERTGDTLAGIAARGGMSRQTLSGLVNGSGPRSFPRINTIKALARGLDLPFESVRHAAAMTAVGGEGADEPPRKLLAVLMAQAEGLTDEELEALLAITRAVKKLAHTG